MAYSGDNIYEQMVPLDPETEDRILGFYMNIGWRVITEEDGRLMSVAPDTGIWPVNGIGYWQTETHHKVAWFEAHDEPFEELSKYTQGQRLTHLMDLVEAPLILPGEDYIHSVIEQGGSLLSQHTHTPLREHAGRLEIRFTDPFLYGVRIATPKLDSIE